MRGFCLLGVCLLAAPAWAQLNLPARPSVSLLDEARRAREAYMLGGVALDNGQFTEAQKLYREATQLAPAWPLAFVQLGVALLATYPENDDAITALTRAVQLDDNNPRAHLSLGRAFAQRDRYEEARDSFKRALALRGDLKEVRFELAGVLAITGPAAEAIATYLEVLHTEPQNFAALSALADLYEQTGQHGSAETALLAITRLFPTVPYHRYRLAQFYERIGEAKKAMRVFAELEANNPRQRKMRQLR